VHRLDAAHLFRLALEAAPAGARLHGVGDEGVPVRDIADVIGRHLKRPLSAISREEAGGHFGWLAPMMTLDHRTSSTLTQKPLGWHPVQPALVPDLEAGHYFNDSTGESRSRPGVAGYGEGAGEGADDPFVTTDLDTLPTVQYVKIADWLGRPRMVGRPPNPSDSELPTLAAAQVLLDVRSEPRWVCGSCRGQTACRDSEGRP
jgi:hypothetical protein